MINKLGIMCWS